MLDITYPLVIATAKTSFRLLGQKFQMTGTEHVPRKGGVLLAVNHVGYVDYIYGGLAANPSKRYVRFMAKREIFDNPVGGPVMRSFHHISVDRGDGAASASQAISYLKAGEAVGIFPEATISRSFEVKELKTGAVRIAAAAGVPLLPVVVFGTQRMWTKDHPRSFARGMTIGIHVGEALRPTGADPVAETDALHTAMKGLLDRAVDMYPAEEKPPGAWWIPARFGGSAPTLEEADELDAAEKRERAARRAAKRAEKNG